MFPEEEIKTASNILVKNGIVAIPTETVYGLAANAFSETAINKVFEAKNRPHFNPLIVHLKNLSAIKEVATISKEQLSFISQFVPGPLTILLPKKEVISDLVTAGSPKVAIRVPSHPIASQLLNSLKFPLVGPSANPFGYVSPTNANHVKSSLGAKVDYILDGGQCQHGLESTIISFEGNVLLVHRLGSISVEDLERNSKFQVELQIKNNSNPKAPGMLDKHYSPKCELIEYTGQDTYKSNVLWFGANEPESKKIWNLSPNSDYLEAAKNLFLFLRQFDNEDLQSVYIKMLPEEGLGRAINDRLRRAMAN